jgi:dipeptidase D
MTSPEIDCLTCLEPTSVWKHFATLCRYPRPSKGEGPLRDHLEQWAIDRGLATSVDRAGNLIIRKAASPGREHGPAVILQAHLDMVCQKDREVQHDFARDPIRPMIDAGWVTARGTTLGADNGMGVALILAALESTTLTHGPLEALFTVDEEAGMGGARGLDAELLTGRLMLNLDTEEWGLFYLGCAGGLDVNVARPGSAAPLPDGFEMWRIELGGLRGGHSGVDIHEQRGNAIKLLVRVLRDLEGKLPLRLATLRGGDARNALPREAYADVAIPTNQIGALAVFVSDWQTLLGRELTGVDDGLTLACARSKTARAACRIMAAEDQAIWLATLHAAPHGVRRMSHDLPGVVETSNNLGVVELEPDAGSCNFMVRSLRDSGAQALAAEISSLFALSGTPVEIAGEYPGWTPNRNSPLLALCQQVYEKEFGDHSAIQIIHAGLECGIIAAKVPGLDIVSFGPTIRGAHAPGEAVEIASVSRAWRLLGHILAAVDSMKQPPDRLADLISAQHHSD